MVIKFNKDDIDKLLDSLGDDDIVEISGKDFAELLKDRVRTGVKGRKPIRVDSSLFDKTVECWQKGEITAREAMKTLNLKPNTFYRRIKERSDNNMKDIRTDIKEATKQIHEDVAGVKQAVEDKKQILDIKREMRHDRIEAKIDHVEDVISMKRAVGKETKEYKTSND